MINLPALLTVFTSTGYFALEYNPYALLSIISFFFNLFLLYLLYRQDIQTTTLRWIKLVVMISAVWAFSESLNRLSITIRAGEFWDMISWPCYIFIAPLSTALTLAFINKKYLLDKFAVQFLIFAPAYLFTFLSFSTDLVVSHAPKDWTFAYYGQWIGRTNSIFNFILLPWIDILTIFNIIFLIRYHYRTKNQLQKSRTEFLITGFALPMIIATIYNGILPIMNIDALQIGIPVISLTCLIFTYGILKYGLFTVNPSTVATNIVDTMSEILFVFNKEHILEYANNAMENILGYKRIDIEGKNIKILFYNQWNNFYKIAVEPLEKGIEKSVTGIETTLHGIQGDDIPFNVSLSPLRDTNGTILSFVGVASDIRKLQELTIITSERNNLSAVMESIKDGIISIDLDNKINRINQAGMDMLHVTQDSVSGKSLSEILHINENSIDITIESLLPSQTPDSDSTITKKDVQVVLSTGEKFYANIIISFITAGKHVGLGAIITINNLTKEKELEEMKVDFISMAVHELRTPLTSIKGYLSVYLEENSIKLDSEQKLLLSRVDESTHRLEILINNLLNVSRIEAGSFSLKIEKQDVNWAAIVNQIIAEVMPRAQEKHITIMTDIPPLMPAVNIDTVRMGEVLANLLTNAINYTSPQGSITVSISSKENQMITSVRDTGRGIPKEAVEHLFTKFYRVSENKMKMTKGNGLGLYISKAIVEMHGGRIWVESEYGKGSTFSFSFPVHSILTAAAIHLEPS